MINNVVLVGRLTKEPELKKTANDKSYMNFSIAINRRFKDENGESVADFPQIICWNKSAEFLSKYAHQGDLLYVEGSIQTRQYEKDGRMNYITEVVAGQVGMIAAKKEKNINVNNIVKEDKGGRSNIKIGDTEIQPDDLPFY